MMREILLDVGCGANPRKKPGINNETLHVSTDFDFNLLRQLQEKGWPGGLVVADARHLPFRSDVFDKVESHHLLEHIPESHEAMSEIGRVTKPGGRVEISVPHPVYDTLMAVSLMGYYPYWSDQNHAHVFFPRRLTKMVHDAGISVYAVQKRGWWRAIATIKNYITARIHNEPMSGHTQRIVSERQKKLLQKKEQFLQAVDRRDNSLPFMNKVVPYETVVYGTKAK